MWGLEYIKQLNLKRAAAVAGGGDEMIAKQHSRDKLTARERISALFDEGTFAELDAFVTSRATGLGMDKKKKIGDGVVTGYGQINGRLAFVSSQDFTVGGGALGEAHAMKICSVIDKAMEMKAPMIFINDSGGARIEEGIDSLAGYAGLFYRNTMASGVIPQISVVLGPCAGGACYSPAITDFIFMTRKNSQMYITGPDVVRAVTGEVITTDELGGAQVHSSVSGVAHFVYEDERTCLGGVRKLLEYLPQNSDEKPMITAGNPVDRSGILENIVTDNPRHPYDVRDVIRTFADDDSFMEVQGEFARNLVVGFARFDGDTIGIVANQSNYMAGSLDVNASDKGARFIRFCDCFNIPLLTLVDVPAFLPGSQQEREGIIRHGAKLLYAYSEAVVPKVTLIMRKAFGGAYIAMNSKGIGADIVYAWPIAELAVMGAEGAVSIIGRRAIKEAADPEAKRQELMDQYKESFMNPYVAAERGYVDEVILPGETRSKIASALNMLRSKKKTGVSKKHGNIPL